MAISSINTYIINDPNNERQSTTMKIKQYTQRAGDWLILERYINIPIWHNSNDIYFYPLTMSHFDTIKKAQHITDKHTFIISIWLQVTHHRIPKRWMEMTIEKGMNHWIIKTIMAHEELLRVLLWVCMYYLIILFEQTKKNPPKLNYVTWS